MTPKEKWKALSAKVAEIEAERARLVAHTDDDYESAQVALESFEDDCGVVIARCEGCMDPIFTGDPYHADHDASIYTCKECSPTYADVLAEPEGFLNKDGDPMTSAEAKAFVDKHVAAGGAVTDSLAT